MNGHGRVARIALATVVAATLGACDTDPEPGEAVERGTGMGGPMQPAVGGDSVPAHQGGPARGEGARVDTTVPAPEP